MSNRPVALVTGGSRGIGRGIALELARTGYDLVISHVSHPDAGPDGRPVESPAAQTVRDAEALGARACSCRADVSRAEDRARLVEFVRERFGRCDLLVNNAGVAPQKRMDILEATEESFDRVLGINLKGPYFLTQAVARWMVEQVKADPGRRCRIVSVSSVSAYTSSTARGEYCVSKAGIGMMTQLYADRLAEFGIGVYEVRPGIIETDMTAVVKGKYDKMIAEGLLPIRRWGRSEDVAQAVRAIAEGRLDYSTGEVINVDGGFHIRRL